MPRQNTCPADFPPFILSQIEQLAQHIVSTRKARGQTQVQWAEQLGISQPTMARIERGDPSIATATYVMCLWLLNPQLDLLQLLPNSAATAMAAAPTQQAPKGKVEESSAPCAAEEFAALLSSWNSCAHGAL
jgi:DNA-binding XRE family transcriptional regulator